MPELTDMQAIITTAQEAVGPSLLSDGRFFLSMEYAEGCAKCHVCGFSECG